MKTTNIWEEFKKDILKENNNQIYYFAYGSNMNIDEFETTFKSSKALKLVYITDWKLEFNKIAYDAGMTGVVDIIRDSGSKVFGILYKMDSIEETELNIKEKGYEKIHLVTRDADGTEISALTYVAMNKQPDKPILPSITYITKILQGLKDALIIGPKLTGKLNMEFVEYIESIKNMYDLVKSKKI